MTLLTEKEAAEKWCPMFQVGIAVAPSDDVLRVANRPADMATPYCIGSKCMAWRSAGKPVEMIGQSLVVRIPDEREDRGYCGAFGKVES